MFETFDASDVRDLIAEFPLAWLVSPAQGEDSLLPLLGEYDDQGKLTELLGHMSRRNPLYARLRKASQATILFNGPQDYVSPRQAGRRDWGPTWNYAQLVIAVDITFLPDATDMALSRLTAAMEKDRWSASDLGGRYAGMAAAVIAFRAEVKQLSGRFKLGQDEEPETFQAIVSTHPNNKLAQWMRRFARRRGP